jgi:hypothetical protein
MATYCYRCPDCGAQTTSPHRSMSVYVCYCGGAWKRDYRAENVGVSVADLKAARNGTGGLEEVSRLMLPTNKDFIEPGDPDGTKGMRQWRDDHQPKAGNNNPLWPGEVERKVF